MNSLSQEVRNIQNPALGATLLWRFACGYSESHRTKDSVPLTLMFIVLPILLHRQTEDFLNSTRQASGLRAFTTKFGESKNSKQDLLIAIHERMIRLRSLSFASIQIAMATRLIHVDTFARVLALSTTDAISGIPPETKRLMADSKKLGSWCSQLTLHEIAAALKIRF